MSQLEAARAAIDYIESNLQRPIGVADMATAVSYSLYHFGRLFNTAVHHTPYDYLIRRRLSEAAKELRQSDRRILDVALDYEFGSPESFARAFKRHFNQQPSQWRRASEVDWRPVCPPLTMDHLTYRHDNPMPCPHWREEAAGHVTGIMTLAHTGLQKAAPFVHPSLLSGVELSTAGVVENEASSSSRQLPSLIKDDSAGEAASASLAAASRLWPLLAKKEPLAGRLVGIVHYHQQWPSSEPLFLLGWLTEEASSPRGEMVAQRVAAAHYATFPFHGPAHTFQLLSDYIYHTWLPQSGRYLAGQWELLLFDSPPNEGAQRNLTLAVPVTPPR